MVSRGLVGLLEHCELEAVLAHERAHLRFGHPRVAAWARALRCGAFDLPPARAAEARIRRQLGLLADQQAARVGGTAPVRAAVVKLTAARGGWSEFVRQRLACLDAPARDAGWVDGIVGGAAWLLGAGAVVAAAWGDSCGPVKGCISLGACRRDVRPLARCLSGCNPVGAFSETCR